MVRWEQKEAAIRALEKNGRVDPVDLINAARDPSHPCHGDFTWDIEAAANERWRDQARAIIRQCKFDVVIEEVNQPVVMYVSSPGKDDSDTFTSLPKMRGKSNVSSVLQSEVSMLSGICSRVYGIAVAKQHIVGADVVAKLRTIRDLVNEIKTEMGE